MTIAPQSLLLVAALAAAPAHALQLTPSPPPHPPKSNGGSSGTNSKTNPRPAARWNYRSGITMGSSNRERKSTTSPLQAYTVADSNKKSSTWLNFLQLPNSFADLAAQFGSTEDSLFSFEGGNAAQAATRPYMPNLELEAKALETVKGKDELLSELDDLTATFADLQSSMDYKSQLYSETIKSYEAKVESLEEENDLLEEGLKAMSLTLEKQEAQVSQLEQEKEASVDTHALLKAQNNLKVLEEDNKMLRQRVRVLEVELSDIAFESRTRTMPEPSITVANPVAIAEQDTVTSFTKVATSSAESVKLSPKAPTVPVPPHISQQRQLENLQLQVEEYKRERSSVRRLFGLGIRKGLRNVGKALNLWSPVHNLQLWGELKGQGKVAW